jgi:hypothetical protein
MRVREGVTRLAIERELLHSGLKDGRDKELLVRFLLQKHNFCFPAMTMYSFYVFYSLKILQARMPGHPPEDAPTVRENNAFGNMPCATNAAYILSTH